jgi:hypothetical protein
MNITDGGFGRLFPDKAKQAEKYYAEVVKKGKDLHRKASKNGVCSINKADRLLLFIFERYNHRNGDKGPKTFEKLFGIADDVLYGPTFYSNEHVHQTLIDKFGLKN